MPRPRKASLDAAVADLLASGDSLAVVAARHGITKGNLDHARRVRDPVEGPRWRRQHRRWQREHHRKPCKGGCGKLVWAHHGSRSGYCQQCLARVRSTTVRPDTLRCSNCGVWQPDSAYVHNKRAKQRRGRHQVCRNCQAAVKRAWRQRVAPPCVRCGGPTSPDGRGRRGKDTGLCASCYHKVAAMVGRANVPSVATARGYRKGEQGK